MPLDRRQAYTLDTDSAPESVENGRAQALLNVQPERGYMAMPYGNQALPVGLPDGTNTAVAEAELPGTGGGLAWLVWNSEGQHSVVRQLPPAAPAVLLTWAGLNLPAPGPDTYLAPAVLDTFLLYLDADGEARNLPLARLAAGEFTPARLANEPWALHLLKVPPQQVAAVERVALTGPDPRLTLKLVGQKAWQFTYRWHYVDGELSVLAPYSAWLDVLEDPASTTQNAITVELPTPPLGVRAVDVLVRAPSEVGWRVAEQLQRNVDDELATVFTFYGLSTGTSVQGDDATRLFEALWPAKALAAAHNRVWAGQLTVGYPTPEPAFTAEVETGNAGTSTATLYTVSVTVSAPQEDGSTADTTYISYYTLASGSYPDPTSTYWLVAALLVAGAYVYQKTTTVVGYVAAFEDSGNPNETARTISLQPGTLLTEDTSDRTTFHERSPYRVVVQFYDALGRPGGCSAPATVMIPRQTPGSPVFRSIRATLTTTDDAALNAEIPAWAHYYQFLVARNDTSIYFLQGRAADVLGYLGDQITVKSDGTQTQAAQVVDVLHHSHEKVWVDIGNFAAAGQGYVWQPGSGDVLRFLNEDKEFVITGQYGDYLEVSWNSYPDLSTDSDGRTQALVEIYSPNTTSSALYYERGPRWRILHTHTDDGPQRSYAQPSVLLEGDCYLVPLHFAHVDRSDPDAVDGSYVPPNKKSFVDGDALLVESMVPPHRLAPTSTTVRTVYEKREKGGFFSNLYSNPLNLFIPVLGAYSSIKYLTSDGPDTPQNTTLTRADTAGRTAANLLWLDMSYGGRPGIRLPQALQQVQLSDAFGYSGARVAGSLLNGVCTWLAADQRELAREQGALRVLCPASDVQNEDQVLLAVCTEGAASIGLNVSRVRQAAGGTITADTSQVVGYINPLQAGLGTRHPRSVRTRKGRVYWWCEDQAEVCRYAADGVNELNTQHQCRTLGQELAAAYGAATVTAAFDIRSKEYLLCFGADPVSEAPARTVRYSERAGGFVGDASFTPEALLGAGKGRLVSLVNGQLWEHVAAAPRLRYYGVAYSAQISVWANAAGSVSKTWQALRVEGSLWELVLAQTPTGQQTRLPVSRMTLLEDVWEGALLMDETSPGFSGTDAARRALYEGVPVQGQALLLTLVCRDTTPDARLLAVGVDYFINGGQASSH